jgi:hypothetical protein
MGVETETILIARATDSMYTNWSDLQKFWVPPTISGEWTKQTPYVESITSSVESGLELLPISLPA